MSPSFRALSAVLCGAALLTLSTALSGCDSGHPGNAAGRRTEPADAAVTGAPASSTPVTPQSPQGRPDSSPSSRVTGNPSPAGRSPNGAGTRTNSPASPAPDSSLPLDLPTGAAQQVVTVSARDEHAVTATLQAWDRSGSGWVRHGPPAVAYLGSAGLSEHPVEGRPVSPMGSFSLTQAFGRLPNPGARLPYFQISPADWWISQAGRFYNTHQFCRTSCPFRQGSPNSQMYKVTPQYDYGVVIDYNRFPVVPDAGSGFFLHVTRGRPTNGCVSTSRATVVDLLRWLNPAARPRVLIGVGR